MQIPYDQGLFTRNGPTVVCCVLYPVSIVPPAPRPQGVLRQVYGEALEGEQEDLLADCFAYGEGGLVPYHNFVAFVRGRPDGRLVKHSLHRR